VLWGRRREMALLEESACDNNLTCSMQIDFAKSAKIDWKKQVSARNSNTTPFPKKQAKKNFNRTNLRQPNALA